MFELDIRLILVFQLETERPFSLDSTEDLHSQILYLLWIECPDGSAELVVDEEHFQENPGMVPLGVPPHLLVLEGVPALLTVPDLGQRNHDLAEELVLVVLVLVVNGHLQHVVNVLHVATGKQGLASIPGVVTIMF